MESWNDAILCYLRIMAITTNITIAAPMNGRNITASEKTIGTMNQAATKNMAKLNTTSKRFII
jgi:hypothetical protein